MALTIGQGMILGAQGYLDEKERIAERQWLNEQRARQRREWGAEDETMTQLSNVGKTRALQDVPIENWQDTPVATSATVDPTIRRSALMQQRADVLAGSKSPKYAMAGIGMEPQVQQAKELEYQQDERSAANAAVKLYADQRDALLELRAGIKSGAVAPEVGIRMLSQAVGFKKAGGLVVAGLPGQGQYMVTDENGRGQFAPVTPDDAFKLIDQADEYLGQQIENALSRVSAKHYTDAVTRGLERRKVGATETSAEASKTTAGAAAKRVGLEERLLPATEDALRAQAEERRANAAHARAGKGAIDDARTAEAEKKRAILAASNDLEVYRGILVQGKTPDGQPLTPEARANYQKAAENAMEKILLLQGREPRTNPNEAAFWKSLETNPPATMDEYETRRTRFGLGPTITPGAQKPRDGKKGTKTAADLSNLEAQKVARIASMSVQELQVTAAMDPVLAPYAQRELDIREGKTRTHAILPPSYTGALPDTAPPLR